VGRTSVSAAKHSHFAVLHSVLSSTGDHFVDKLSAIGQPGQLSLSSSWGQ